MENTYGVCKYCGQVASAEEAFESKAEANRWASENCTCASATAERRTREQIEDGCDRVDKLFGSECEVYGFEPVAEERILEKLCEAVKWVAKGYARQIVLQLADYGKATIGLTAKGRIRVSRSESRSYQLEE